MAFLSPTPSIMSGLDPRAQQLIQDARNMGLGEDEIAQMLDSSGFNPMEYANDLYAPSTPLPSKEPSSTIPPQVAQTLAAKPGMEPTFTPPAPPTLNKARIGTGDESYGDFSPDVFNQRFNDAADAYGVPRDIAQGMLNTENTTRNPYAINGQGSTAIGLGQLTEAARADYNKAHGTNFSREDFFDPDLNTDATFWYLTTRDGKTIQDKVRAYNQGNGGAAKGLGYDYLAKVTGGAAPGMTTPDGTSAAAPPPAYDDLPTEAIPPTSPGMRGDILGAEPGGEVDTTSESPGIMDSLGTTLFGKKDKPTFFGKLMGTLGGPLGEGLMGMGAGILGARGTYGNTFQAIGQGGEKGLEAYGYAQRRAQRDREAAAAAKVAQEKLKSDAEARKYTRTNMKMQTLGTLADKFGPKAMVQYLRANPDLLEQFGGSVDPSMFKSKDGWKTTVSNGYIIRTNDSGESQLTKLPEDLKIARVEEINEGGKNVKIAYDETGKPIRTLGAAPTKESPKDNAKIVEARPSWDQESGVTVMHRQEADGSLTPLYDENGQPRYGAQGGKKFIKGPDGKMQLAPKEAKLTDSYASKLREDITRHQIVTPVVRDLIGDKDKTGRYPGGMLTDDVIGMAKDVALRKRGYEATLPALKRIFNPGMRDTMPADGPDERSRFQRDKWFNSDKNKVSESDYLLSSLAFQLAIASNPDGRISDADMALARERLGGDKWALASADDVRQRVASFAQDINRRAASAYQELGMVEQMPISLREFYLALNDKDMQPDQVTKRKEIAQKWASEAPTDEAPPPESKSRSANKTIIVRNKETGEKKTLPPGVATPGPDSKYEVVQ